MTNWNEIENSRAKAHEKHGDRSIENLPATHPDWLAILGEEFGEVAKELTYDGSNGLNGLRSELIDVISVASAWLDKVDRLMLAKWNIEQ